MVIKTPKTDDQVAIPEARIVKYNYLFDYYDAKDMIMGYTRTGKKRYLIKATNNLLSLYIQLRHEFSKTEIKKSKILPELEYHLRKRKKIPTYNTVINFYFLLQSKLKSMKILNITFPEADIGKDFVRSF